MRKSCAWSVPGPASPKARVRSWTIEKHDLSRSALAAATRRVAWDQILIVYPAALSSLIIENPIASIDSGMALYTNPSMSEGRAPSPFSEQTPPPPAETRSKLLLAVNVRQCLLVRLVRHIVGGQEYKCEPYVGMLLKLLNQRTTLVRLSV